MRTRCVLPLEASELVAFARPFPEQAKQHHGRRSREGVPEQQIIRVSDAHKSTVDIPRTRTMSQRMSHADYAARLLLAAREVFRA